MGSQVRGEYDSESVIPFAPEAKKAAPDRSNRIFSADRFFSEGVARR